MKIHSYLKLTFYGKRTMVDNKLKVYPESKLEISVWGAERMKQSNTGVLDPGI